MAEEFKFPGFRPGKAPRNLVEQKVGKDLILNNAAEKAIGKAYVDFIKKEKLDVLGTPEIKLDKIEENTVLVCQVSVAVMPETSIDPNYKEEIKKANAEFEKKNAQPSEEDIDLELEKLANSRVKLVTVRRAVAKNDSVEVDFVVSVGGVPIENGTSKNHALVIGRGVFIPGFEENLIGMNEGEEKEFELAFPEDYYKKDLAGKKAVFKVKMNLVQERQLPEINDEFAVSLGNFKDLAALKQNIKEGLEHENEHKLKDEKNAKYIEVIQEKLQGEIPEILEQEETHRMFHEFEDQLQSAGMKLDDYLEKLGKKRADLEKDWQPQAQKRVKSALALRVIAKEEEIKVETAEIEVEMNKTIQYYKDVKDFEKNVDTKRLFQYTKGVLENEKIFEFLGKIK